MIDSDYRILKSKLSSSNFMHGDLISKYILVVVCAVTTFGVVNSVTAQTNESMMNQTGMNMTAPETLSGLDTELGNDSQIIENVTDIGTPNNTLLNSLQTNENQSN
jgi:hypothetical protein